MAQAALIAETIAGMKRAIARHQDASDSDEPYLQPTNRGNKLKRKAHHIQDGPMGRVTGSKAYRRTIEYAGYYRRILRRNPKRYDEDGDELEEDEEDEEVDLRAAEENPYAQVRLENILLPLASAACLPEHPSLSVPYFSPTLTNMAQHACEMVQRERKTLCSAKQLLTKLRGDETWIPCGLLCSEHDDVMFNTEKFYNSTGSKRTFPKSSGFITQDTMACGTVNGNILSKTREGSKGQPELDTVNRKTNTKRENLAVSRAADSSEVGTNGTTRSSAPTELNDGNSLTEGQRDIETAEPIDREAAAQSPNPENPQTPVKRLQDTVGTEISTMDQAHVQDTGNISNSFCQIAEVSGDDSGGIVKIVSTMNGNTETKNAASVRSQDDDPSSRRTPLDVEADKDQPLEDGAGDNDETQPPPRRMRTRAQVQAASEPTITPRTESPDLWVPPNIHPLFMIPNEAIPDHDFGLPPNEAEETRRMIILYVQKQEEVCRGAEKLYEGLLQADRQRKTVLKWCKAEGHVGEMSDGEDWYDKEEWGLEDDLRKGHNDDEDDSAIQGKKTRGRRA